MANNVAVKTILILSSNPEGTSWLEGLNEEVREIREVLRRANERDRFKVEMTLAVEIADFYQALLDYEPQIVHFCGHGAGENGIVLQDKTGQPAYLSADELAGLFKEFALKGVECVVLNACYSEVQANAISQYVNYVIGMNQPIGDKAAIDFSTIFYSALGDGENIKSAFNLACNRLIGFQENEVPVLKINPAIIDKNILEESLLLEIDKLIDPRYEILETIIPSNVAPVYKARDRTLERDVAIKVLNREDLEPDFDESLKKAVKISDEANFITIYDAYLDRNPHYCILQFVDGETIRQTLTRHGKLPFNVVSQLILKIGDALVRARELKNIYGNIKPSNIMLIYNDNEYEPFISPLDLCKDFSPNRLLEELERKSKICGKQAILEDLAYLLPENFSKVAIDFCTPDRSDQYSLGLLAYELLTGQLPPTLKDIKGLKKNGDKAFKSLISITDKCHGCPTIFEKVILKMTSCDPANRYETLQQALDIIRGVSFYLNTAKESYARCTSDSDFDNKFFKTFYHKFLTQFCPHAAQKFLSLEAEGRWKHQHQQLKEAIVLLFAYYELNERLPQENEQEEPNVLSRIAEMHSHTKHDIPKNLYTDFINALINTVIEFDPKCQENEDYQELIGKAWQKVLAPGVEYMKSKY
ncbi:hypothetical protein NUACC21_78180 [Scytonema sp. NUACC21]